MPQSKSNLKQRTRGQPMKTPQRTGNRRAARRGAAGLTAGLLLVCAVLLPGCSGGGVSRRGDTSSTLYIGEVGAAFPTSYMPWLSRDGVAPTISSMVYSTLSQYDENTGEYHPLLADSWC